MDKTQPPATDVETTHTEVKVGTARSHDTYRIGDVVTGPDRFGRLVTGPIEEIRAQHTKRSATAQVSWRKVPAWFVSVIDEPSRPRPGTHPLGQTSVAIGAGKIRMATPAEAAACPTRGDWPATQAAAAAADAYWSAPARVVCDNTLG